MKYDIDTLVDFPIIKINDVRFDESVAFIWKKVLDVPFVPCQKVIYPCDCMSLGKEMVGQVGCDKPSGTGNDDIHTLCFENRRSSRRNICKSKILHDGRVINIAAIKNHGLFHCFLYTL